MRLLALDTVALTLKTLVLHADCRFNVGNFISGDDALTLETYNVET
jgi:hypothetical protein